MTRLVRCVRRLRAARLDGAAASRRSTWSATTRSGDSVVHALRSINLSVAPGELIAVRGRSGSGKTTLLNLLGGLDRPTSGKVVVDGHEISSMGEDQLVDVRRRTVAFVFQAFGLVPFLSATENVEVPLRLVHANTREREARVATLLDVVGLGDRAKHRPHELSGGEQQRVALARALANGPKLLLADEPTGQLDSDTGHVIMLLLRSIVRHEGITAVVATHDPLMLDVADRVFELRDGRFLAPAGGARVGRSGRHAARDVARGSAELVHIPGAPRASSPAGRWRRLAGASSPCSRSPCRPASPIQPVGEVRGAVATPEPRRSRRVAAPPLDARFAYERPTDRDGTARGSRRARAAARRADRLRLAAGEGPDHAAVQGDPGRLTDQGRQALPRRRRHGDVLRRHGSTPPTTGVVLAAGRQFDDLIGWIGDLGPYYRTLDKKKLWDDLPIVVVIDDGNGYRSIYAHMSKVTVEVGQTVRAGQRIGLEGRTGHASGCHVHYGLFSPFETDDVRRPRRTS